jgi:hypothetical protein
MPRQRRTSGIKPDDYPFSIDTEVAFFQFPVVIVEVEARDGRQFGIEGLRESVRFNLNQSTESLLDAIVSDVCKFGDSTVLTDDACLVAAEL